MVARSTGGPITGFGLQRGCWVLSLPSRGIRSEGGTSSRSFDKGFRSTFIGQILPLGAPSTIEKSGGPRCGMAYVASHHDDPRRHLRTVALLQSDARRRRRSLHPIFGSEVTLRRATTDLIAESQSRLRQPV